MKDQIRMDSHKLMYHPHRVSQWLSGGDIYPIEIEIGLSGACNHRCTFCAVDYMGYTARFLDTKMILKNLSQLSRNGLKSVIFSGEGEPLLHKDAPDVIRRTKELGIDAALATNGVLFTKDKAERCLPSLTWIRFSIAAATEERYRQIHRGRAGDLETVWENLEDAVKIKHRERLETTLGAQMLLLPENKDEAPLLARHLREIGIDYLAIKPYSQHPSSCHKQRIDYSMAEEVEAAVRECETDDFKIHFRWQSIVNVEEEKSYDRCYALPFMVHIDAAGDVYPCIAFVGDSQFCYGNLYSKSFDEIWKSEHVRQIMSIFQGDFLRNRCRKGCRLEEMNKYLFSLKYPDLHVNFI